ncbi:hypothetical protein C1Y63_03920 [Corynebacterium sp. 13CS0277]|nr:hypothetical protein C1Y63_03920 [Corynebacterium sp. 13CS0277]
MPSQRDLKFLDDLARSVLPEDPTPTLEEIAAQPDVPEQAAPQPAPQAPYLTGALRVIVVGTDAALSAVATRMMRADTPWVELAYVPMAPSTVAATWGIPEVPSEAVVLAVTGAARPTPMLRDDAGVVVVGQAEILQDGPGQLTGEIVVDNEVLTSHQATTGLWGRPKRTGPRGARIVATTTAPGLVGTRLVDEDLRADAATIVAGRAAQAGGPALRVTVDGVPRPRAVEKVTIYRHLRDLQAVRP